MDIVRFVFTHDLDSLVSPFVHDATSLIAHLTALNSFIGGEIALLFILRTCAFKPGALDIFAPCGRGNDVITYLRQFQQVSDAAPIGVTEQEERRIGVEEIVHLRGPRRRLINVHCGTFDDGRVAIAGSWSTHLVNYVNAKHFGSAYPDLLWTHRGILGDCGADRAKLAREAAERGLEVRVRPSQWPDLDLSSCGASQYACGTQVRTFDDRGCLRARMDPRQGEPLKSEVWWRMTLMPCGGPCLGGVSARGVRSHRMFRAT